MNSMGGDYRRNSVAALLTRGIEAFGGHEYHYHDPD
jgi:hypothetical protein